MSEEILAALKEISGREDLASVEDFKTHYDNLNQFRVKKTDDIKSEIQKEFDTQKVELANKAKEEVKKELEPYKKWIEDAGIKDIKTVNPIAVAEYIGEQHEDIKPRSEGQADISQLRQLETAAFNGNEAAQHEIVKLFVQGKWK